MYRSLRDRLKDGHRTDVAAFSPEHLETPSGMEALLDLTESTGVQPDLMDRMRRGGEVLRAESAGKRLRRIRKLRDAIKTHKELLYEAFAEDLGKSRDSVDLSELLPVALEIDHALQHARSWIRGRRVAGPLPFRGTRCEIRVEPKGVALIISAWNYPFLLTLGPLVSAICAGCSVVIKPSEFAPNVAAAVRTIVESCFDPEEVRVIEGDEEVSKELVSLPFGHIYFTGSTGVGKAVMKAASENLTSVTLELGGKSPTIVDETADIDRAAERIAFGKFSNAGQTCLAPDHLYVHESKQDALLKALDGHLTRMYGGGEPSDAYGRIVTDRHHVRLAAMCADAVARGGRIIRGGGADVTQRYIEPTIIADAPPDSVVMTEEIFGPVLPLIPFTDLGEVLADIATRSTPLAVYVFSNRESAVRRVTDETRSGSVVVNDTVIQFANPFLPFGGAGDSGMGRGHGYWGFLEFSNVRSVLRQRRRFALTSLFYPPYSSWKRKGIRMLLSRYKIG
jgi:aldehyde dehydrogenase (NAD+)